MTPTDKTAGVGLAYPGTPYQVMSYNPAARPELPAGHGAIAMDVWCPPRAQRFTLAPIVGVDGQPAMYGFGRALIVVPAGERLVEVQYVEPQRSMLATVSPGAVVPLEYAAAQDGRSPGSLGPPAQRPAGRPLVGVPVLLSVGAGVAAGVVIGAVTALAELPYLGLSFAAMPLVAGAIFAMWWRRSSRRRR